MRRDLRGAVRLKGIVERRNADGSIRRYLRRGGRILGTLPADLPLDHPRLLAAYAALLAEEPAAAEPGTVASLTVSACRTARYRELSDGYRAMLRRHFEAIRAATGKAPVRGLRPRHVTADVEAADSPVDRLKAWRFLTAHAVARGLMAEDAARPVRVSQRQTDGHPPWTADEIDIYRARWPVGTVPRLAFEVLHWTGCRIGDAVRIGPGMVDRDGVLVFRQGKTGGLAYVPWTCALPPYAVAMATDRAALHEVLAARTARHMTWLATAAGAPRSSKALGRLIRDSARAARIEKSAHGLRKARAQALAEGGATTHQIAAWTGHETLKEVAHYTAAADRRRAVMGTEQDHESGTAPAPKWNAGENAS